MTNPAKRVQSFIVYRAGQDIWNTRKVARTDEHNTVQMTSAQNGAAVEEDRISEGCSVRC